MKFVDVFGVRAEKHTHINSKCKQTKRREKEKKNITNIE